LFCIAVSSPGVFDAGGNVLSQNTGYGRVLWSECNLLQTLQTLYAVPVIVKNDIKAATLGEWAYGAGRGEEDLLYVSCGVGLGAGIVLRSKLYEGRRFSAGEVYYTLDTDRLPDAETLEDRICMKRLIESSAADVRSGAQTCLRDCDHPIGFEDIVAAYRRKDPFVCEKVRRICDALCALMFNLGNFLALDKIIFGGEYATFSDTLLAAYEKQCKPLLKPGADVCLAALGRYSGIYGMLFTAREACFDAICRQNKAGEPKP
jgi:predicted NBD/HSP70 family sugar kinase